MTREDKNSINFKLELICVTIAFVFVILASYSTSPIYSLTDKLTDSYMYQIIGKYWDTNNIPYINLFDHKGPLIFMISAIGYRLTGNRYGIFIIQIIFMYATVKIMHKLFNTEFSSKKSVYLSLISLLSIFLIYTEGNLTEEYILPFVMISFYYFYKWLVNYQKDYTHKVFSAFIYGVTFGIALMTRVTNAIGICFIVFFILIILLKNKAWRNILYNAVGFIIGVILIAAPFVIYFYTKGALSEMIYGTIGHNINYALNSSTFAESTPIYFKLLRLSLNHCCYVMLIAGIIMLLKSKDKFTAAFLITTSLITTLMFLKSRIYIHYMLINLPYFVLGLVILKRNFDFNESIINKISIKKIIMGICSISFLLTSVVALNRIYSMIVNPEHNLNAVSELMKSINKDESFIAWNLPDYIYLKYDIKPCYKYFVLQEEVGNVSKEMENRIYNEFKQGSAKWIVVEDGGQAIIQNILDSQYSMVKIISTNDKDWLLFLHK